MSDDKDKIDVAEVIEQEATPEESVSRGFDDELFTSAEYNFKHLTDGPKPVPQEPKISSEPPPVIAEASSANHQETSPSNDPVCGEADTSAPPAILPARLLEVQRCLLLHIQGHSMETFLDDLQTKPRR